MNILIPQNVDFILKKINSFGYEANIVGGCVRDSILGKVPKDWDITTSAKPNQIIDIFKDNFKIIENGLKHGTVTVMIDGSFIEITTYRIDGEYMDNRHPDHVIFTNSLQADLARRDFTMNALAYNPEQGITDYFNGFKDIQAHIIRCVGNPDKRFIEDGLRIMRALRFSSELGFSIDTVTQEGIIKNQKFLYNISAERLSCELLKLLCGCNVDLVLRKYSFVLARIIPELLQMIDFKQNSPYHDYDIWEHTIHSIKYISAEPILRITMLLHDIGKPACHTIDENKVGHFYGHPQKSTEITNDILKRLKFSNSDTIQILNLIKYHDITINSSEKCIKKWLNKLGEHLFFMLLKVKEADLKAQSVNQAQQILLIKNICKIANNVILEHQCFSLKSLKVNGKDLMSIGIQEGKKIGQVLQILLNAVIEERCPNNRDKLLEYTKQIIKE